MKYIQLISVLQKTGNIWFGISNVYNFSHISQRFKILEETENLEYFR